MGKKGDEETIEDVEEEETEEQIEEEEKAGDLNEDVYTEEGSKLLEEDDEITEIEEGVMEGYDEDAKGKARSAKCDNCGRIITDKFVELTIGNDAFRFCSARCADTFKKTYKRRSKE